MAIVVIADIIGSRQLEDRSQAQRTFDATIARVERDRPLADQPLRPTVGDEQQAVYPGLFPALASLLMLQLALPDGHEFRFGIGVGQIRPVGSDWPTSSAQHGLTDGPGWWAARDAIEIVHARQQRAVPGMRTWIVAAPGQDEVMEPVIAASNAYLLARDEILARMTARTRRLVYGRIIGLSQQQLAEREGITQPGVSKALRSRGASALMEGLVVLGVHA